MALSAKRPLIHTLEYGNELLVKDNPVNAEVAILMLVELGIHTVHVWNGPEVIENPNLIHQHYQLILMDCLMAKLVSYSTSQSIRSGKAGEASRVFRLWHLQPTHYLLNMTSVCAVE